MKNKSLHLLFLLLGAFSLKAQTVGDSTLFFDNLFKRNYFELGIVNGFNRLTIEPTFGSLHPKSKFSPTPALKMAYHINIDKNREIITHLNIGAFPFSVNTKNVLPDFNSVTHHELFFNSGVHYGYRWFTSQNSFVSANIGVGANFFRSSGIGIGTFSFGSNSRASFNYSTNNIPIPYFGTQIAYNRVLKNRHILAFIIGYQHSLYPVYKGDYEITDGNIFSMGNFTNKGHMINIGLSYHLTNGINSERYLQLSKADKHEQKTIKKEIKKEQRFIHPKDVFFTNSIGLAFSSSKPEKNQSVFGRAWFSDFIWNLSAEKGIKNYYFGEIYLTGFEYMETEKLKNTMGAGASNAFYNVQLLGGINKKIINPSNNKPIVNIHAGLGIGMSLENKGIAYRRSQSCYDSALVGGDGCLYSDAQQLRKFFPLAYIGISKDIRLGKGFYLNLAYRYNQGLLNVYQNTSYSISNPEFKPINSFLNGSYHSFQIGFKYRIKHFGGN
jgi:hypothetical protein